MYLRSLALQQLSLRQLTHSRTLHHYWLCLSLAGWTLQLAHQNLKTWKQTRYHDTCSSEEGRNDLEVGSILLRDTANWINLWGFQASSLSASPCGFATQAFQHQLKLLYKSHKIELNFHRSGSLHFFVKQSWRLLQGWNEKVSNYW